MIINDAPMESPNGCPHCQRPLIGRSPSLEVGANVLKVARQRQPVTGEGGKKRCDGQQVQDAPRWDGGAPPVFTRRPSEEGFLTVRPLHDRYLWKA